MNGPDPMDFDASRESDFNERLKEITAKARELELLCERFTEQHGTDCDCIVCAKRAGAVMTPAEVCEEIAWARKNIRRHLIELEGAVIEDPPHLEDEEAS